MAEAVFPTLTKRVSVNKSRQGWVQVPPIRPSSYKKSYTTEQMHLAYIACQRGDRSIRRVAEEYGVPKSTLQDRISGKVLPGSKSGKKRYLDDDEEGELVKFLINCSRIGFPRSRSDVIRLVQAICDHRGVPTTVSHGWWERFCARHPNITLRAAANLSHRRFKGASPEAVTVYFEELEETLSQNDLLDKPGQIFNLDESGMPLDPKSTKAVTEKGSKDPSSISSGNKAQITVVSCVSATGVSIPPMILFDRKTLHADMAKGEIPGTYYGLNSGWMNQELFEDFLTCHFLRYAPQVRPILLLLDGHSSHYNPAAIRAAAKEQIILFTLPPHTTHITQPLDRGCFGPLKTAWRSACHEYMRDNPGKVITKFSFNSIFAEAYKRSMTMDNIISSFRATGVYPVDRSKVLDKVVVPESISAESDIAYVPLLSAKSQTSIKHTAIFTEKEMVTFQERYNSEADREQERYLKWKDMYHPPVDKVNIASNKDTYLLTPSKKVCTTVAPKPCTQQMFKPPPILVRPPKISSAKHSLTSAMNLKRLDKIDQEKKEKEAAKKEREAKREQRKKEATRKKQAALKPKGTVN